ncbi:MAG: hypothetical protein J6C46_11600 [Clostridia bacterium]|nr:hypothetical protein [Clostridia bacterium]
MYKVKLIGPGLKIENKWHWIGETVIVNKEDYEKNKKYLEVIEIIEDENSTETVENKNESELSEDENTKDEEENEETEEDEEDVDEEMEILRKKATELGIEFRKNTKKETLIKKISEAENK